MGLPRENVQDYPRPPALEPAGTTLRIVFAGRVIAESGAALRVLETHHAPTYYLPPRDIADGVLRPVTGRSFCEWKGRASYFDVSAGGRTAARAAWCYPSPTAAFRPLTDYVAFYAAPMDACFVGDEAVIPQPGDFYGGWVTANLDGIVKGDAETRHW